MCSQAILGKHVGRIITNKSQSVPFDPPKPPLEDKKVALTLSEFTHSQRAQLTMVFFFSVLSAITLCCKDKNLENEMMTHP